VIIGEIRFSILPRRGAAAIASSAGSTKVREGAIAAGRSNCVKITSASRM
jgi:hypothetical protein